MLLSCSNARNSPRPHPMSTTFSPNHGSIPDICAACFEIGFVASIEIFECEVIKLFVTLDFRGEHRRSRGPVIHPRQCTALQRKQGSSNIAIS